ncbi:DUF366 family protein [Desulfothermobacter acidiphilus]|uniref:DUF366 family protein n=1 Tax=Desulfothermobacter acidiphilus TaxID=1938353 RepID=UPI003F88B0FC
MRTLYFRQPLTYDGSQLSSLWAFRHLGVQGDSIVAFRGPCRVEREALVDLADYLAASIIYSPDMLHFLVEHFETDLEKGVLRQRLLVVITKELLEARGMRLRRRGDDLFVDNGKLSVSVATATPVSLMIHLGLNLRTEGVPVQAAGLLELGWKESEVEALAGSIMEAYAGETKGVYLARCKVRGVP